MPDFKRYTYNGITCQATRRRPSSRDDKKYMRDVSYDGKERLVHYGDPDMPMQRDNEERRESFLARHSCDTKKDPFAPGFWACYDWQNTSEKTMSEPIKAVQSFEPLTCIKSEDGLTAKVSGTAILFDEIDLDEEVFEADGYYGKAAFNGGVDATLNHRKPIKTKDPESNEALAELVKQTFTHPVQAIKENGRIIGQHILDLRSDFEAWVFEQAQKGAWSWSTGTSPHLVEIKNGRIKTWIISEMAYTPTPAQPKNGAIKQAIYPRLSELEPEGAHGDAPVKASDSDITQKSEMESETMSEQTPALDLSQLGTMIGEQLKTAITPLVEEVKAMKQPVEPVKSGGVAVVEDEADRALKGNPFKTAGEFYESVMKASTTRTVDARLQPLKSEMHQEGVVYELPETAVKHLKAPTGLSEVVPANGGFLVGTDRRDGVITRDYMSGMVWNRAFNIGIGPNSNGITVNALDETSRVNGSRWGGVLGYWLAEADEKTASKPTFRQMEAKLKKVAALVYATDELMMDSTALASVINSTVPAELAFQKDDAAINGSGVGKPLGILNSPALVTVAKEAAQAASTILAENIIKMRARRWARGSYVWFINQDVEPQLHQLNLPVGTGGALVYMPPGGLSASPYGTLYGDPVIPIEQAATLGTVGDIMLVDMSQYLTISKGGIQTAESIHVRFIYDESVFRFVERVDGMPMWDAPLTPFKGSNTQSPFVALATRS